MAIPNGAILEAVVDVDDGSGIAIYDVSHLLIDLSSKLAVKAFDAGKDRKKAFGKRDPARIDTLIIHKSGGNGPPGYAGAEATTRFVVYHRGWSGAAYTFWLSRSADRDSQGRIVVYRCQSDEVRSWHTGGRMNAIGVGLGVQGNYDGNWDLLSSGLPKVDRDPTKDQWEALPLMVDWIEENYPGIDLGREDEDDDWGLTGHWEHGKSVCPGDALRWWTEERRGEPVHFLKAELSPRLQSSKKLLNQGEVDPFRFKPKEYQKALVLVGFSPGPVDGKPGMLTRAALEGFQKSVGIKADGWYGMKTAMAMQATLRRLGLALATSFDKHPPKLRRK